MIQICNVMFYVEYITKFLKFSQSNEDLVKQIKNVFTYMSLPIISLNIRTLSIHYSRTLIQFLQKLGCSKEEIKNIEMTSALLQEIHENTQFGDYSKANLDSLFQKYIASFHYPSQNSFFFLKFV